MSTIAAPAFFHAYNNANNRPITEGADFPLSYFKNCGGGGENQIYDGRALLYGEIKTYFGDSARGHYDIGFSGTIETRDAHGYQNSTNGERVWGPLDDGAYAIASGNFSLEVKDTWGSSSYGTSQIEETRIYGLRLVE